MGFYSVFQRFARFKTPKKTSVRECFEHMEELPGVTVHYQWLKKKNLSLKISGANLVRVRAPRHVSQEVLRVFVLRHLLWIRKKLALAEQRRNLLSQGGPRFFFLGKETRLKDDEVVRVGPKKWYRKQAMRYLPDRFRELSRCVPLPGNLALSLSLRWMKTRWGTCRPDGRIALNTALMICPPQLIDYVIIHELAHLLVPAHNEKFYRLLESWLPGAVMLRKELNGNWSHILAAIDCADEILVPKIMDEKTNSRYSLRVC